MYMSMIRNDVFHVPSNASSAPRVAMIGVGECLKKFRPNIKIDGCAQST